MDIQIKTLILAPHFHTFIGDSVIACSGQIDHTTVISHHNVLSELATIIPFDGYLSHVKKFSKRAISPQNKLPDNMEFQVVTFPYLIPDGSNRALAEKIAKHVRRQIERNHIEFNLIHSHFIWPTGGAGAILKNEYNSPLVITAHGYDVYTLPFKDSMWTTTITRTLNQADHIITVSQKNFSYINKLNVKTNVSIIPNGYNVELFFPMEEISLIRTKLGLPIGRPIILSVGNLEPVKGFETLIDSIWHLIRSVSNVLLVIIGSGSEKANLEKRVHALGLSKHIIFVGERPHSEIPQWMNSCDVFALSSNNEGNPTVMFECLGCGKPFIGTCVGGIPEIISSEAYGLLCEPGEPKRLADNLLFALKKEWDNKSILAYGNQFTWNRISQRIVRIYRDMLKTKI